MAKALFAIFDLSEMKSLNLSREIKIKHFCFKFSFNFRDNAEISTEYILEIFPSIISIVLLDDSDKYVGI